MWHIFGQEIQLIWIGSETCICVSARESKFDKIMDNSTDYIDSSEYKINVKRYADSHNNIYIFMATFSVYCGIAAGFYLKGASLHIRIAKRFIRLHIHIYTHTHMRKLIHRHTHSAPVSCWIEQNEHTKVFSDDEQERQSQTKGHDDKVDG